MKPIMRKTSPQLTLSAIACALAMGAFAFTAPAIDAHAGSATPPVAASAVLETPALPALPFAIR